MFAISLVLLASSITLCSAQEVSDDIPCIILAKARELYDLELYQLENDSHHTIIISFDFENETARRLQVQEPYISYYDSASDIYCIDDGSGLLLCTIKYVGIETVLLGEERAKLEVDSTDYEARLVGVHLSETPIDIEIPKSFGIILALCSLLPFFLLAPDAITDLQAHLEVEAAGKGVYGRILALLLPLLTIGLTFWLLESLSIFG
ncbi:MAG: hypothetical protein ACTSWA_04095 [Candidatus Thorarchaeota archaeon]